MHTCSWNQVGKYACILQVEPFDSLICWDCKNELSKYNVWGVNIWSIMQLTTVLIETPKA